MTKNLVTDKPKMNMGSSADELKINMGLSFHVNDDPNEHYTFIVHIDDEK